MILYIIRHGQTDYNLTKRFQGKLDIPLNGTGIESAKRVAAGMRDYPIDLVISSPLSRAVVTAEIVTEGRDVPLITDDRLMEISLGEWEGCGIYSGKDVPPEEGEGEDAVVQHAASQGGDGMGLGDTGRTQHARHETRTRPVILTSSRQPHTLAKAPMSATIGPKCQKLMVRASRPRRERQNG